MSRSTGTSTISFVNTRKGINIKKSISTQASASVSSKGKTWTAEIVKRSISFICSESISFSYRSAYIEMSTPLPYKVMPVCWFMSLLSIVVTVPVESEILPLMPFDPELVLLNAKELELDDVPVPDQILILPPNLNFLSLKLVLRLNSECRWWAIKLR